MAEAPVIKYARVNATADGDNVVIAAVAGAGIRVIGYVLTVTAAGVIKLQDTAATPAIHAELSLPLNGVAPYAGGLSCPAFETAAGTGVEVNNPAAVDTLGHIAYTEV